LAKGCWLSTCPSSRSTKEGEAYFATGSSQTHAWFRLQTSTHEKLDMLTKLVERFDPYQYRVRENAPSVAEPFEHEDDDEHEDD
jgi:hypothetical protein